MAESDWLNAGPGEQAYRADIWSLTPDETCQLVASTTIALEKPFIIRTDSTSEVEAEWFMENLLRHVGTDGLIDVQMNDELGTKAEKAESVVKRIQRRLVSRSMSTYQPLNCLNISNLPFSEGEPRFIRHPRFRLGDIIGSRLAQKIGHDQVNNVGKKTFARPSQSSRAVDVESGQRFHLLSSAYTVSRFHRDCYNCTWIKCISGVKAWFLRSSRLHDADVRLVILKPGDTLFMPAGTYMEHAVVTLVGPCIMVGGQRFDAKRIVSQLDQIRDLIEDPSLTNEDVPALQLPQFIDETIEYAEQDAVYFTDCTNSFKVSDLHLKRDQIKAAASCACLPTNEGQQSTCKMDECSCHSNNRQCTSWCVGHTVLPCSIDQ